MNATTKMIIMETSPMPVPSSDKTVGRGNFVNKPEFIWRVYHLVQVKTGQSQ